jgi:hypothetical protein
MTHIYQKRERNYVPMSKISIKFCKYFVSYSIVVTFVSIYPQLFDVLVVTYAMKSVISTNCKATNVEFLKILSSKLKLSATFRPPLGDVLVSS